MRRNAAACRSSPTLELKMSLPIALATIVFGVVSLVIVGVQLRRAWVYASIAALLFVASAVASIWVLLLGWLLAALGILLILLGVAWALIRPEPVDETRAHPGVGLLWPGLALLAAPFVNAFLLMPVLRASFT